MNGYDFILNDNEFRTFARYCASYAFSLEKSILQYEAIIDEVLDDGVSSGEVHEALRAYKSYVIRLSEITTGIGDKIGSMTENFIKDVEEADDALYDAETNRWSRDFSDKELECLMSCVSTDYWFMRPIDRALDWAQSIILKMFGLLDRVLKEKILYFFYKCHDEIVDYQNWCKQRIQSIFNEVYALDAKYGGDQSGTATGAEDIGTYGAAIAAMAGVTAVLREMSSIIAPGSGSFNAAYINSRLSGIMTTLESLYDECISIKGRADTLTTSDVAIFAGIEGIESYFGDCYGPTRAFEDSLNLVDYGILIAGKYSDIDEQMMKTYFKSKSVDLDAYASYETKKALDTVFDQIADMDDYADSETHENIDVLQKAIKEAKKQGKNVYELLIEGFYIGDKRFIKIDGRTKGAKNWLKVLDKIGELGDLVKYGDEIIEYFARLLANYSVGLEVIDSFMDNYSGEDFISSTMEDVRALYEKSLDQWFDEALNIVGDVINDQVKHYLKENVSMASMVMQVQKVMEGTMKLTGLDDVATGISDYYTYHGLYTASQAAYQSALTKFREADPSAYNYEDLAKDLSNCFNMCKTNAVKMFEAMKSACYDNARSSYYGYCASKIKAASMTDKNPLQLMSYEEFMALA